MTSKGQFTLPAKMRKAMGATKAGDKLILQFHEKSSVIEIKKIPDLAEIRKRNTELVRAKGIPPLTIDELRKLRQSKYEDYDPKRFN